MNNSEMKKMLIKASVFTVIAATIMLQRSATKHIMISDAAGASVNRDNTSSVTNLLIDRNVDAAHSGKLTIPLSRGVGSDDIALEDDYMNHELRININGREEGFYLDTAVVTDLDIIKTATCEMEADSGNVCLVFGLDGLYANSSTMTDAGTIEVSFCKPQDMYDRIVVVDPVYSDVNQEKDIALDVAKALKAAAEKDEEHSVKLYFTRISDSVVDDDSKRRLLEETSADLVIGLGVNSFDDENKNGIETLYNDTYFLRGFNNADFATTLEKHCVEASGANALGVHADENKDMILSCATVPSAKIMVATISGNTDSEKTQDGAYKAKIAQGIYDGLLEAFEEIK